MVSPMGFVDGGRAKGCSAQERCCHCQGTTAKPSTQPPEGEITSAQNNSAPLPPQSPSESRSVERQLLPLARLPDPAFPIRAGANPPPGSGPARAPARTNERPQSWETGKSTNGESKWHAKPQPPTAIPAKFAAIFFSWGSSVASSPSPAAMSVPRCLRT